MASQQWALDMITRSRSGQSGFLGSNLMWWKYREVMISITDMVPPTWPWLNVQNWVRQ